MTKATVNEVIKRAVSDAAFRRQLQRDPSGTLAGFELTADERAAITGGDPAKLMSLGIDQRMSKAFVIGGLAGSANASVESGSFNALIDEKSAGAYASGIELDPGHVSGTNVIAGDPGSASVTAFDTTTASTDLNRLDAGTLGGSRAAVDPGAASGDLNAIDAGYTGGAAAAREAASAGGRSAALGDPARSEDMSAVGGTDATGDLNAIDAGYTGGAAAAREAASAGGRSAALTDPARNEDPAATAFEAASDSGDLNAIDAGIVENDTSASGADSGGLDSGGDVRPTEY